MSRNSVEYSREAFRRKYVSPNYSGPLHLATTVSICLVVALLCAVMLENVQPLEWLTIPLTFLYANLSEYLGHRGPMHHRKPLLSAVFQRHTIEHHAFFTDQAISYESSKDFKAVLFPPILLFFFIGAFAVPAGALLFFLVSANVAFLFMLTAVLYFLNYELLHFAYHVRPSSWIGRLPFMSRLRQHHAHHHNPQLMTRYNFNITYPLCDYFFGTVYKNPK
ncbi:MAG: sterol desaturase family protein [Gammaproteobacteria bacterium]|nr:sterol desaturase family protein [Gammaproteobacteria bacterium]MDH4314367.1 sterol desaturase family protein [Gammaproteobacteria bacterium]MDH5214205.1 sterol desaturase family protein [Gammaproteobacteria bacterium]MDH5499507.1 sterol desaturase family protein [Gammaproteobacteria bacterium]